MNLKITCLGCITLVFSVSVLAVMNYDITLPSYPPGESLYNVSGLNDYNQIVGEPWGSTHYLWQNGTLTMLPVPNGMVGACIMAINNLGEIIGADEASKPGFLLVSGTKTWLGTLGGDGSLPCAINDNTQIVGRSQAPGYQLLPFLWQNGTMTSLGSLGGTQGCAFDINIHGVIVGYSKNASDQILAFIYRNGSMAALGTLGGNESVAAAINDANDIVGCSRISNGYQHAFVWKNGVMTDLGTLGGNQSQAFDINNAGLIFGWAETAAGYRPLVVWENGHIIRLNSLVAPDSGWELVMTESYQMDNKPFYAVNNNGALLGKGFINGGSHPFLMLPRNDAFFLHDSNQDGKVNLSDFVQMSNEWLK